MAIDDTTIERLLERAGRQDGSALGRLLEFHRRRLRRMVAKRLDQRLAARIDPSDVVQEALFEAELGLPEYIRARPVPFFVWLRDIARDRLTWWTRRHTTKKRDAFRDLVPTLGPSCTAPQTLVDGLVDSGTSPSGRAIRAEENARAVALLGQLGAADRRVLELRYLEGLSIAAIARALDISLSAAQMRQLRALERLRERLVARGEESRE
jgi:RNA polymerase sigma-70 factor (ECF subfamily)